MYYYDDEYNPKDICQKIVKEISSYTDFLHDFYTGWIDSGASTITPYLDELSDEQLTETVECIIAYVEDVYKKEQERGAHNKAIGIKCSLLEALKGIYSYLDTYYPDITQEDLDEYDDIPDSDIAASDRKAVLRNNIEYVESVVFPEEESINKRKDK